MLSQVTVEKVEERWTATTIQAAFVFHFPSKSKLKSVSSPGAISINLPLLHLGWTFALSLTPERSVPTKRVANWILTAFSFRQHGSAIHWGSTSICAQLSLGEECTPHNSVMGSNLTPLGTMNVVLARTPALDLALPPCTVQSSLPVKVWLSVTISECPLGLFEVRSGLVSEAEVQTQLLRQSCGRLLSRSLANGFTGKLFDVKFLAFPTRFTSGSTGVPLQTRASLCVLEEHVNLSESSVLKEGWTNALAALDNPSAKRVGEILCPKDYEYELDSDFEDEDEVSFDDPGCQHSDSDAERSSTSLSSFEMEDVRDQDLVVAHRSEEIIKESSSDYERTLWIKFAAHRTWHAFLWYCYTGNLKFGKLKSQVEPGGQHLRVASLDGEPPTCSPKSMYRLADLIGDEDLKAKALVAIKQNMSEENVLDETFSVFTSKYPDVREIQLGMLMKFCRSPRVKEAFLRAIEKYSSMPHARPVFSAFYDNLVGTRP